MRAGMRWFPGMTPEQAEAFDRAVAAEADAYEGAAQFDAEQAADVAPEDGWVDEDPIRDGWVGRDGLP